MTQSLTHRLVERTEAGDSDVAVDDLDPSDQRVVLAHYNLLSADQVGAVVNEVAAFKQWRSTPVIERGAVLLRAAQHLRDGRNGFAAVVSSENGKTLREAGIEVDKSADFLEYYGGMARGPQGNLLADGRPNTYARVLNEPIGLVLAICPWNDPLLTPARKLAPALYSGNSVLLKPARDTPLAGLILEEALLAGGLPPAALGVLITDHSAIAEKVLGDPRLAGVTFTGSTEVGHALRAQLGVRNVRVQTEMGGKNAAIVTDDADVDLTVASLIGGAFGQAGQRCTATSRLIVTHGAYERVLEALLAEVGKLKVGPANAADTTMGPVVNKNHRAEVSAHVQNALDEGAQVLYGGTSVEEGELAHGCFFRPTVLGDISNDAAIWREEVFGPVLAIRAVASLDEALALANAGEYGLAASVFTSSLSTAERAIAELDAGQVGVNLPTSGWDVHQPFGGFKESGSAFKEQGVEALRFYTKVKTAAVRFA